MSSKKIIYIGNFSVINMNAAGKRIYNNCLALESLGYTPIIIGQENTVSTPLLNSLETKNQFQVYNYQYPRKNSEWISYNSKFKQLVEVLDTYDLKEIKYIVIYNSPSLAIFNKLLIKYCRKHSIKVISDCTDWLTSETGNFVFDFIKNLDTYYQRRFINQKCDGLIAISQYLYNYYSTKLPSIIIPPLNDLSFRLNDEIFRNEENNSPIKLVYAGIPFRPNVELTDRTTAKDRLDLIIKYLHKQLSLGSNFILNIYGITNDQYLTAYPSDSTLLKELGKHVRFNGLVSQKVAERAIGSSDFMILIREDKRDTLAGFPTKIAESISLNVPVITTNTGDIGRYISDDLGFIIDITSPKFDIELEKILKMKKTLISKLKMNCAKSRLFDWKEYKKEFEKIFVL